jgi:hypothetical protein
VETVVVEPLDGEAVADQDGDSPDAGHGTPPGAAGTWVAPDQRGTCPASHPVKAKLSSKVFHLPGMSAYDRTSPDRCYCDEPAAEADGLRRAKR